jgi:hypothetical protein
MKKIVLLAIALVLAISSFSQSRNNKGVFDNAVYFRVGGSFPGGDMKSAKFLTAGAQFEAGTIFYINAIKLPEQFRLGVDVTYVSVSGFYNKESLKDNNETISYFTAGSKVGPCFSYNFQGDWIIDAYIKLFPHQFITGQKDSYWLADNQFRLGTSMGLNIRWKVLMLGWEYTSAKYKYYEASPSPDIFPDHTFYMTMPVTNLTLGLNF